MITIWHNPKCSKSKATLEYLNTLNEKIEIIEYLKNIPSRDEIKDVLKSLSIQDIIRSTENAYEELNIESIKDENTIIDLMLQNPVLIQRPIVIQGKKASIARPLENVIKMLEN